MINIINILHHNKKRKKFIVCVYFNICCFLQDTQSQIITKSAKTMKIQLT